MSSDDVVSRFAVLHRAIPLGHVADPEQIADVVVCLTTALSHLIATTVAVDGAMTPAAAGL